MAEDLGKAEDKVNKWFALSLLLGIISLFLSALIIGHGSFDFSTPIPIIVFGVVTFGLFSWAYWKAYALVLQPDWKTLGTGRRASFSFKVHPWNICTFHGLGNRRQDYLDLVTEGMRKEDFQLTEESPVINIKGSDLMFKGPGQTAFFIRAVPIGEDLRVGFILTQEVGALAFLSLPLALPPSLLILYIIRSMVLLDTASYAISWGIIYIILMCAILVLLIKVRTPKTGPQEIKNFLVKIGESMGSKQITPFKRILVKY